MPSRELDRGHLLRRIEAAVASAGVDAARCDVRPLQGGASSLTYRADLESGQGPFSIVVKVAPRGLEPVGSRDVLRQADVLRHLRTVGGVPVPEVLFSDEGTGADDPPLFGMSLEPGVCFEPCYDEPVATVMPPVDDRMTQAVRTLATLHSVPAPPQMAAAGPGSWPGASRQELRARHGARSRARP